MGLFGRWRSIISNGGGTGGSVPSNVILFEDWNGGESVTIDTSTSPPSDTSAPIVTVSPNRGTFASSLNITLTANETSTIYYTLDGTTPTTSSTIYSNSFTITDTTTLKFFGKDSAGNISLIQSVTFTKDISAPADTTAPVLTITPAATFADSQTVTMSVNETADIWYTTDGSDPVSSGTRVKYSVALTLTATTTIKAYAVDNAGNTSGVQSVTFTKQALTTQTVIYPENGYLVMPVNRIPSVLGEWKINASFTNATYTTISRNTALNTNLFDSTDLSTLMKLGTIPYVSYNSISTANYECLTINNSAPFVKTLATNGTDKDTVVSYLQNKYGDARLKLSSTYGTYIISSNISNVTTRATSNNGGQYFKCALLDGLGVYTGGSIEQFNSIGYDMQPAYSWTHVRENIKINSDGTLEMVVPTGTFTTIDQASVSAYLASKNIKIYY